MTIVALLTSNSTKRILAVKPTDVGTFRFKVSSLNVDSLNYYLSLPPQDDDLHPSAQMVSISAGDPQIDRVTW